MEGTDGLELSGYLGRESEADSNTVDVEDSHMLLALTRPSRSANLSQLDIQRRHYSTEGVTFTPIYFSGKAIQAREAHSGILFSFIPYNVRLCPVITPKSYKERTEVFRSGETQLFLAAIKPHRAVSSSSIARWLKGLLEVAEVAPIQLRGTSSSTASNMGISTF